MLQVVTAGSPAVLSTKRVSNWNLIARPAAQGAGALRRRGRAWYSSRVDVCVCVFGSFQGIGQFESRNKGKPITSWGA